MRHLKRRLRLVAGITLLFTVAAPHSARAGFGDCGQPLTGGNTPTAGDALGVLRAAVGAVSCPLCVCDVNSDGGVTSGDALRVLRFAVGQPTGVECIACKVHKVIGASGGSISPKDDSFTLTFPPGALNEDVDISIEGAPVSDLGAALGANGDATAWKLLPDSLELAKPAIVSVDRDDAVVPGAGVFGAPIVLFLSKDNGVLEALADQGQDLQVGESTARASLEHFSVLGIIPVKVTPKISGVPGEAVVDQVYPITAQVTRLGSEAVVDVASARYVDDDFGNWQPVDGVALDDELEETIDNFFGDSYDYTCISQISVGYSPVIETVLDVIADVPGAPAGIQHTTKIDTTIACNP